MAADFVTEEDAARLREAWLLSSRLRSAITLLTGQTAMCCPRTAGSSTRSIGRLLGYPDRSATELEEDYLGVTRRARKTFEQLFLRLIEQPQFAVSDGVSQADDMTHARIGIVWNPSKVEQEVLQTAGERCVR